MGEYSPPLCDANLSNLVYSGSPSTITSTFLGAAPPVFSREARLAILVTPGAGVPRGAVRVRAVSGLAMGGRAGPCTSSLRRTRRRWAR